MGSNISRDQQIRTVLDGLRHVVRELRVSARAAERRHGISGAQLFVLNHLADGRARSVNDLAARTFTHQSSVSALVTRLATAGLVRCSDGHDDARRTDVALTPAGRKLLRRAPEPGQARLIVAIASMTAASRRRLSLALTDLVEALGAADGDAELFFENDQPLVRRRAKRSR